MKEIINNKPYDSRSGFALGNNKDIGCKIDNKKKNINLLENLSKYQNQIDFDYIGQDSKSDGKFNMIQKALKTSSRLETQDKQKFLNETVKDFMQNSTLKNIFMSKVNKTNKTTRKNDTS